MSIGSVPGFAGLQGTGSAGPTSQIARADVQMAKDALKTPPQIAQAPKNRIIQQLEAGGNIRLSELGGKIPENGFGIMAALKAAVTTVRGKIAQRIAEATGQGLMGNTHVVSLGVPGKSAEVFQKCIGKMP